MFHSFWMHDFLLIYFKKINVNCTEKLRPAKQGHKQINQKYLINKQQVPESNLALVLRPRTFHWQNSGSPEILYGTLSQSRDQASSQPIRLAWESTQSETSGLGAWSGGFPFSSGPSSWSRGQLWPAKRSQLSALQHSSRNMLQLAWQPGPASAFPH